MSRKFPNVSLVCSIGRTLPQKIDDAEQGRGAAGGVELHFAAFGALFDESRLVLILRRDPSGAT